MALTRNELNLIVKESKRVLSSTYGVTNGDVVAVASSSFGLELIVATLALWLIGATVIHVDPHKMQSEFEYTFSQVKPKYVIVGDKYSKQHGPICRAAEAAIESSDGMPCMLLAAALDVHGKTTVGYRWYGGDANAESRSGTSGSGLQEFDIGGSVSATTPALIVQISSGTERTGPTLVYFSHQELLSAVQNASRSAELTDLDNNLVVMPLCDVYNLVGQLLAPLACLGTVVLPVRDAFNPATFFGDVRRCRITWCSASPWIYHRIMSQSRETKRNKTVRFVGVSFTDVFQSLPSVFLSSISSTFNSLVIQSWSLAEACHTTSSVSKGTRNEDKKAGSRSKYLGRRKHICVGKPVQDVHIRDREGTDFRDMS